MLRKYVGLLVIAVAFLTGCEPFWIDSLSGDELNNRFDTHLETKVIAQFDPLNAVLPLPFNLTFSGSEDGTNNIPVSDPDAASSMPFVALNTLDGWSTVAPMTASFSGLVDPDTVLPGVQVRLFEVNLKRYFLNAQSIIRELQGPIPDFGIAGEYVAAAIAGTGDNGEPIDNVIVLPTVPLKPEMGYLVVITKEVTDLNGLPIASSTFYNLAKSTSPMIDRWGHSTLPIALDDATAATLEPLRQLVSSYEAALAEYALIPEDIALSWAFTTQSVDLMLKHVAANVTAGNYTMGPIIDATGTNLNTSLVSPALEGIADLYIGSVDVPYYLDANNPSSGYWTGLFGNFATRFYNYTTGFGPAAKGAQTIPFVATVPNAASGCSKPAGGWPVSIFVHTMTQNRVNLMPIAEALASETSAGDGDCTAGVAIDLPLHGVDKYEGGVPSAGVSALYAFSADAPASYDTGGDSAGVGLYAALPWFATTNVKERTLGIDTSNNETGLPGADGEPDASGGAFFNPAQFLTTRDNFRQGIADNVVLSATLGTMRNTWQGGLYGLGILSETSKLVPGGETDDAGLPASGIVRDAIDAVDAVVTLGEDGNPNGGAIGAMAVPLTMAGAYAGGNADLGIAGLVESTITLCNGVKSEEACADGDVVTPVPTAGLIYDAIAAGTVAQIAGEYYTPGACGGAPASAAEVAGYLQGAMTAGADTAADGYLAQVDPENAYTAAHIDPTEFAAGGAYAAIGAAASGGEAVAVAQDLLAAAIGAVVTAAGNAASNVADSAALADEVSAAVDAMVGHVDGLITAADDAQPGNILRALASDDGNLPADLQAAFNAAADASDGARQLAKGLVAAADNPAYYAAALQAKVDAVQGAAGGAAAAGAINGQYTSATVGDAWLVDHGVTISSEEGILGMQAGLNAALAAMNPCTDPAYAATAEGLGDVVAMILGNAGGVAASVQTAADELALNVDNNSVAGIATGAVFAAVGNGADINGVAAYVGGIAGAVADVGDHIFAAASVWEGSDPVFDGNQVSIIGHGVGASIASVVASIDSNITHAALLSPSGALAYSFESSATVGPMLEAGLAAAAGLTKGSGDWNSFFFALQTLLDAADPINYADELKDSGKPVYILQVEDDAFFPSTVALPTPTFLGGTSVLAREIGVTATSSSITDGPVHAMVTFKSGETHASHTSILSPAIGCAETDVSCVAFQNEVRLEMLSQVGSFIKSGGMRLTINPRAEQSGNQLVE